MAYWFNDFTLDKIKLKIASNRWRKQIEISRLNMCVDISWHNSIIHHFNQFYWSESFEITTKMIS